MPPPKLKEIYQVESSYKSFYTGGNVEWSQDGKMLFCQCGGSVQFLDVETGLVTGFVGDDSQSSEDNDVDTILTFKLCPQDENIVSAHKSGLLKLWDYKEKTLKKHWRSVHNGPVAKLAFTSDKAKLISGGSDSSIRIWDLNNNTCLRNLTDMKGVCSVLEVIELIGTSLLCAAGDDWTIKVWDLGTGEFNFSLEGHYSTVTAVGYFPALGQIVSCGRDKVLILWNVTNGHQIKVIPTYECMESLFTIPSRDSVSFCGVILKNGAYVATAGERGVVRLWDVEGVREVIVQNNSLVRRPDDGGLAISKLLYCPEISSLAIVSHDHNIFIHSIDNFICTNQFIGYSDEILDIAYVGEEESHIAVATNSPDIKLYRLANMSCSLLTGHTGFVVTIAVSPASPNFFASASKDNSVRVWLLIGKAAVCVASGMQHNNSVSGLAFSQGKLSFLLSGGEDNILKLWKISKKIGTDSDASALPLKSTCVAHEKEINAISVSPNDKIIATASLDKTAKLWSSDDLTPLGTLSGHRRGVWSVVFSPVDQVVLTSSADTTLKIWSIVDLSCLKTLEGHESSVMKGLFLSRGLQVISASGDGLIKLWNIKSSECVASFDEHTGKVWALAVSKQEDHLVSGCSASKLVIWRDVTEEKQLEEAENRRLKALNEQKLSNLIESKQFLEALRLALSLNRPATVLNIVQEVIKAGGDGLSETVTQLEPSEQESLLNCCAHWNTNSKTAYAAQTLISILLPDIMSGALKPPKSLVEVLIPYTERHFTRLTQLLQDLHLLEYTTLLLSQK